MAITKRAMKNLSRAYNRYMQHVKFVKRVKDWFAHEKNDVTEIKKALSGENYTFLRTTGRPCNCEGCTYLKYKRTPKHKVMKEVFKD